jgi:plastocyanin
MVSDGEAFYIAESNRGQIIRVTPDGAISRVVDLSENHPVPTGIAIAPGGGLYVGNLTAFPYSDGAAKVVKVTADGQVTDVWTGLTALTAIAVAPDGTLYALEMSTGNPTQPPFTRPNSGKVVRQTGPSSKQDVVTGLDLPVAMRFGPDGALYVGFPALSEEGKPGGILRVDVNATGNGVAAPSDPLAESQCPDLTAERLAAAAPAAPATPSAAPVAPTTAGGLVTPIAAPGSVPGSSVAIVIDIDVKTTGSGATVPGTASCPSANAAPPEATTVADQGTTASGDVTINVAVDVDTSAPCPANVAAPTAIVAMPTATAALPMPTATQETVPSAATPVAAASTSTTHGPGHPLAITISNFAFDPARATIPVGTTVTWTNHDQIAHTATSTTGVFSSGNLNQGQSYSYTFTKAGTYPYICIYHPYMKGTIVVQ